LARLQIQFNRLAPAAETTRAFDTDKLNFEYVSGT
jgi:hypothetical protein